jgi:hypothetical protein
METANGVAHPARIYRSHSFNEGVCKWFRARTHRASQVDLARLQGAVP